MLFGSRQKKPSKPQGFQPKKNAKTLILEPLLTPMGVVDGFGDEMPELVDVEMLDAGDVEIPEPADLHWEAPIAPAEDLETEPLSFLRLEEAAITPPHVIEECGIPEFESGVFTVGETGEVSIDFLYDGGKYKGELAIFSLDGMEDLEPGSRDFIETAATRAASNTEMGYTVISDRAEGARFSGDLGEPKDWNSGEYLGEKTFTMRSGDKFGIMLVPNGTVDDVIENPEIGGSKTPLFSLSTANPEDNLQMGQIADVTGDGSTFVFEDVRSDHQWFDEDYNDFVFKVKGATGEAIDLDEVIDPADDWRETELGQEILDYAIDPVDDPVSDPVDDPVSDPVDDSDTDPVDDSDTDPVDDSDTDPVDDSDTDPVDDPDTDPVDDPDTDPVDKLDPIQEKITEEILPGVSDDLDVLDDQLTALFPDLDIPEDPAIEVELTEENFDEFLATAQSKLDAAIEELKQDQFADADVLASQYNFKPEDQPLIGVIDTGFAKGNPDIDNDRIIWGSDRIDNDDYPMLSTSHKDADHGTKILEVIAATQENNIGIDGVNDDANVWLGRAIGSGKWADSLTEFVDAAKTSGQPNAVVNLSFDLAHPDGTPRTELTIAEREALQYARDNNVLVVVAAGNEGIDLMSALGQASEEFDNIITVGAADGEANRAEYSSYGEGLDLLAYGTRVNDYSETNSIESVDGFNGLSPEKQAAVQRLMASDNSQNLTVVGGNGQQQTFTNIIATSPEEEQLALEALQELLSSQTSAEPEGVDAIAGTSIAAAKVTGAASQVWAANPDLSFAEVKALLKGTATDLGEAGWDLATGAGLLNLGLAVKSATDNNVINQLQQEATNAAIGTVGSAIGSKERPAFLGKLFKGIGRFIGGVVRTVARVVKPIVNVVKKVVGFVVSKVKSFVSKAKSFFGKVGRFFGKLINKFINLPIIGKIATVLDGIGLTGGFASLIHSGIQWLGGVLAPKPVQPAQIPDQILQLEAAWNLLSAEQKNDIRNPLLNGLTGNLALYRPLFDGSDPDGILSLLETWGGLSQSQQQSLGYYIVNGLNNGWDKFQVGQPVTDLKVNVPQLKNAWNSLKPTQQQVLAPFLNDPNKSVVNSTYGYPLFNRDPDGVGKILAVIGEQKLTDEQRNLLLSFMLHSGGIPTEHESRFP